MDNKNDSFLKRQLSPLHVWAIAFGCFVYTSNNTVSAAALDNWPDRVMLGEWFLLAMAEELLGIFGKVLVGLGVSCAVLSGIMGFYLASSRLMYSMSREGYLPVWFGLVDPKYGTPKNAMLFCMVISLSGPVFGREALGWFVDMSAIGASIGYFFTSAATLATMKKDGDGTWFYFYHLTTCSHSRVKGCSFWQRKLYNADRLGYHWNCFLYKTTKVFF